MIVGQVFALVGLAAGFFFFIFAAKYYFSILLVLIGKNRIESGLNWRNFNNHNGNGYRSVNKNEYQRIIEKLESWYEQRELAVIQGYQWHYLNAGENWMTRGIRAEYSSSYVIERTCQQLTGAMKMISGSVFMIKADVLKKHGWSNSMT